MLSNHIDSPEKRFYRRHYAESLSGQIDDPALNRTRENLFARGKRYHLVEIAVAALDQREFIVELGCGNGEALRYAQLRYGFTRALGLDIALNERKVYSDQNAEMILQSSNLNENLEIESDSVDCLIAMMVIEHLFDPFHIFTEIRRILRPSGLAIVNLPLVTGMKNRIRLLSGSLPVTSVPFGQWMLDREWDGNHLHYFSLKSIELLLAACGLVMVEKQAVGKFLALKNMRPQLFASEITFVVKAN